MLIDPPINVQSNPAFLPLLGNPQWMDGERKLNPECKNAGQTGCIFLHLTHLFTLPPPIAAGRSLPSARVDSQERRRASYDAAPGAVVLQAQLLLEELSD